MNATIGPSDWVGATAGSGAAADVVVLSVDVSGPSVDVDDGLLVDEVVSVPDVLVADDVVVRVLVADVVLVELDSAVSSLESKSLSVSSLMPKSRRRKPKNELSC